MVFSVVQGSISFRRAHPPAKAMLCITGRGENFYPTFLGRKVGSAIKKTALFKSGYDYISSFKLKLFGLRFPFP